jgi:uncharacterized protein YrrD
MEFKYGASVYASDGRKAGRLNRIVVDPEINEVTHIVIQKGLFVKEDKVVVVQDINTTSQDEVTMNCTTDVVAELPPLEIERRETLTGTAGPGQTFQTLEGGIHPPPGPEYKIITETKRTIPEELVALKDGAQVMSADDEEVGKLEGVLTESETCNVTGLIVSQGALNKTSKAIPIQWVKMLGEDEIHLTAGMQQVADLPEQSAL